MTEAVNIAVQMLKTDEGCELTAYPDPLSGGAPWTIGYGCTGPDIVQGTVWTQAKADSELEARATSLGAQVVSAYPWSTAMVPPRQAVLINMAFQMGMAGLAGFPHMLAAAEAGDYVEAAAQMDDSAWAKQTPAREQRESAVMKTGSLSPSYVAA